MQVIYNFGREDTANREALQRLVASATRFLDPDTARAASAGGLESAESRPLGGTWVPDALRGASRPVPDVGKSRDHRDDLPQIVIGMAVTRDGTPVRVWCWPGETSGSAGFTSAANRRYLHKGGGSYSIGEEIRSGTDAAAALSRRQRPPNDRGNPSIASFLYVNVTALCPASTSATSMSRRSVASTGDRPRLVPTRHAEVGPVHPAGDPHGHRHRLVLRWGRP